MEKISSWSKRRKKIGNDIRILNKKWRERETVAQKINREGAGNRTHKLWSILTCMALPAYLPLTSWFCDLEQIISSYLPYCKIFVQIPVSLPCYYENSVVFYVKPLRQYQPQSHYSVSENPLFYSLEKKVHEFAVIVGNGRLQDSPVSDSIQGQLHLMQLTPGPVWNFMIMFQLRI